MGKTIRKVGLEGVKFNAAIGFYEEERIFKNNFLVDVSVAFEDDDLVKDDLKNTVNYVSLFDICNQSFSKEAQLIETVAQEILQNIKQEFTFVDHINIKIKKLDPPVKAQIQNSFVALDYTK
ncbi:dihydroneopterin aldolase [Pedobacter sp. SD-b]|uniref:7,8-dihydroneopterin aldolase n=1 Tax=Pedobacter segetis TaxID=2793069 RepID=A0ABS1BI87_9SPHI|nr:dihydroneopterin aldolase [Pedobacter segetis]MBK0381909.1 dihydroneopterin aldolase [Pedobacter segetis]